MNKTGWWTAIDAMCGSTSQTSKWKEQFSQHRSKTWCGTVANAWGQHIALLSHITINIIYPIVFKYLQTSWGNIKYYVHNIIVFKHKWIVTVVVTFVQIGQPAERRQDWSRRRSRRRRTDRRRVSTRLNIIFLKPVVLLYEYIIMNGLWSWW